MPPPGKSEGSPSEGTPSRVKSSDVLASVTGPTVPDYNLLRRIGHGAYGDVWLARSKATGAFRAAKIVWRRSFEDDRPFRREFEGIQRFERISREHPSQLALFHIGRNDAEGYFYYVMELADQVSVAADVSRLTSQESEVRNLKSEIKSEPSDVGCYSPHTLRADLERGRLPAAKVLEIGLALSEALLHLHSNGLVHRDVKPSNVIFVNGRPKLADIGLVTDASDQCSIVGTEGYLPPEGPGTPQADIFALGKVLYEAATGLDRREFPKLPDNLRTWPDVKQVFELNEIILKACAQNAKSRYQTCNEMHADLALLGQGKSVKQKRTRQQRWLVCKRVAIGVAALAAVAAVVFILVRGNAPTDSYPDGPNSTNLIANADCEKGLAIIREDNYTQLPEAYAYFTNAISLDPHFARPYVGLLEMALRDPGNVLTPMAAEELRKRAAACLKELAPKLGATFVAQSINSYYDWNFPAAERYVLQGIKANPRYELGHTWYGYMLAHWGRPDEGRAQIEISQTLAPSKGIIYQCIGGTYYAQRDFTNAIIWLQKDVDLDDHNPPTYYWLGRAQRALGDYEGSMDTQEKGELIYAKNESAVTNYFNGLRQAYYADGTNGYWLFGWKLSKNRTNDFFAKAMIQIHLGNKDAALDFLEKSFAAQEGRGRENSLNYLLFDESWDGVRDDPRFVAILNKIGYTKVMPARKQ